MILVASLSVYSYTSHYILQNTYNSTSDQYTVSHVSFNISSSLLCIVLTVLIPSVELPVCILQLYAADNYVWYLKYQQSLEYVLTYVQFDAELAMRLHIGYTLNSACLCDSIDFLNRSTVAATEDCTIAVVNGNQCLLTPLGKAIVPPPMSKYQVASTAAIRHVIFYANIESAWGLACVDDKGVLKLYHGSVVGKPSEHATIDLLAHMSTFRSMLHCQIIETSRDAYVILCASAEYLHVLHFSCGAELSVTTNCKKITGNVLHITPWNGNDAAFAVGVEECDSFDVFRVSVDITDHAYMELQHEVAFPEVCSTFQIVHCNNDTLYLVS